MIILCLQGFKIACGLMYATGIPRRCPKPESETPPFTMPSSHIQRRPVLAGPASLVLARPLGEPLSLRRPGSLPWDINQSLDGQLLPYTTTRLLTLALGGSLFNAFLTGS